MMIPVLDRWTLSYAAVGSVNWYTPSGDHSDNMLKKNHKSVHILLFLSFCSGKFFDLKYFSNLRFALKGLSQFKSFSSIWTVMYSVTGANL